MEFKQHLFLNNKQVTEEIKKEIKKCIETNDNENTTQNLWYAAKAILRGKFIAIQSYLKKQEKHLIYIYIYICVCVCVCVCEQQP